MRRSRATLLKGVVAAACLFIGGPIILRHLSPADNTTPSDFGGQEYVHMEQHQVDEEVVHPPARTGDGFVWGHDETNRKIDWHNWTAINLEKQRTGPGEQGTGVDLPGNEGGNERRSLFMSNGFAGYVSDKIALDRTLKDIRHKGCQSEQYRQRLPSVSMVIPFHNEHRTTLLRTFVSCLKRAPPGIIKEVILADDFSTKEFLGAQLEEEIKKYKIVRVVRAKKREGLIRTRLLGAREATGQVLIFLDSHCECNVNWLPPLLDPIAEDYRTVVCPFIDVLDFNTFQYRAQDDGARGAFDWEMFYKRLPLLPEDLKNPSKPFKSPVMAGGLFAISTKWFWELGGYDPGLDIWGGEQYELSFKVWQCHGKMVDAPCSRIGHVYRKFAPFSNPGVGDFMGRNMKRVAEVWMDEYKEYLYKRRPNYRALSAGDIAPQVAIREKLSCRSFKWFMTEVAFDLSKVYPPVEPPNFAEGELRHVKSDLCVDTKYRSSGNINLSPCVRDGKGDGEQDIALSWHADLRPSKRTACFDVSESVDKAPVILYNCHNMRGNQFFKYDKINHQVLHPVSGQCLDADVDQRILFMRRCNKQSETQRWTWLKMSEPELDKLWAEKLH